ncbi:MAG: hypothetical protein WBQ94_05230 [Terracidiphilus sp.]
MGLNFGWGISMLTLAAVPWSLGQTAKPDETTGRALVSSPQPGHVPVAGQIEVATSGEIFREINDPKDGTRWLLSRDVNHPGGPGVLALAERVAGPVQRLATGALPAQAILAPIIHAGDRLILEEHSAAVDSRLEAIAMAPGALGSVFPARLSIGGKVVRARALAAGRAVLEPESGGWQ